MVLKDATSMTPLAHEQKLFLKSQQHTMVDPRGPEEYQTLPVWV